MAGKIFLKASLIANLRLYHFAVTSRKSATSFNGPAIFHDLLNDFGRFGIMNASHPSRKMHADFQFYLNFKDAELIALYHDLRNFILELCPDSNELLYHTHALTSLYSASDKMQDGFCMIPIYTSHLNLGFNKGTLLPDPQQLLQGTGKLIRHIPVTSKKDYDNAAVKKLVKAAWKLAVDDNDRKVGVKGQTISKIRKP